MRQSAIKRFHRGSPPVPNPPRPDLTRLESLASGLAVPPERCPTCGGSAWNYETTGDGGVVQFLRAAKRCFRAGVSGWIGMSGRARRATGPVCERADAIPTDRSRPQALRARIKADVVAWVQSRGLPLSGRQRAQMIDKLYLDQLEALRTSNPAPTE